MQLAFCYGRKLERAARSIAIPDDATQDPGVERRPSAYFFIGVTMNPAHEIDHLVYQRLGYEDITKELARHNEADPTISPSTSWTVSVLYRLAVFIFSLSLRIGDHIVATILATHHGRVVRVAGLVCCRHSAFTPWRIRSKPMPDVPWMLKPRRGDL